MKRQLSELVPVSQIAYVIGKTKNAKLQKSLINIFLFLKLSQALAKLLLLNG
jgi:hypothetical protein